VPEHDETGESTVQRLRRTGAARLAELLQRDAALRARAVEFGLVRPEWIDRPDEEQMLGAKPLDVVERFLAREVDVRPSTLSALGLSAIQVLAAGRDRAVAEGVADDLTVVFTDLEGFSSYTEREGDENAGRVIDEHQRVVGRIVRSRGGRVVKHLGDGTLVTFAGPEAAVLAGLELVEQHTDPLRLRVGMHCGEVRVLRNHDVLGHVVNVAARVVNAASGGEVVVTGAVRDSAAQMPDVAFGPPKKQDLKGLDAPIEVCRAERAAQRS
jgi:adenylate cyclase